MFAEDCIRQFNGTPTMKKVILSAVDPRDFMGVTIFDKETQQNKPANLQDALTYLNEFLAFDGYEIVPHGKGYDVVDKTRGEIVVDVKLDPFRKRRSTSTLDSARASSSWKRLQMLAGGKRGKQTSRCIRLIATRSFDESGFFHADVGSAPFGPPFQSLRWYLRLPGCAT
jgi:hypothetical protein